MILPVRDLDQPWLACDEPGPDLAIPCVRQQPSRPSIDAPAAQVAGLLTRMVRCTAHHDRAGWGTAFHEWHQMCRPLTDWAIASWEYLLSTEGCRFLQRTPQEKLGSRGDYRALTARDYPRFVHRQFTALTLELGAAHADGALAARRLVTELWPRLRAAYRYLERPPDPSERRLTAYSYLRCIPYTFFQPTHQQRVERAIGSRPSPTARALRAYFLEFRTVPAIAAQRGSPVGLVECQLQLGLGSIAATDHLAYALLRQIERY